MTSVSNNTNDTFISALLAEIELCFYHKKGSLQLKESNIENGNPGSLLSNTIFKSIGGLNSHEPLSQKQKAEFRQWIEYVCIYGNLLQTSSSSQQVLKELNSILAVKSFLTSSSCLSLIDAVFYGLLYNIMSNITYQEKEQYMHLSRWFNTIQHDTKIRRSRNIINFSRCSLYG